MQTRIRRGLLGALFAGTLLALGTTAASASEPLHSPPVTAKSSGDQSIDSGNQGPAPATAAALSAAALGDSPAINTDGNHKGGDKGSAAGPQIDSVTSADHSIASGNQGPVPVTAPATVTTVTAAVLDDSPATNTNGNHKGADKGSAAGPQIDAVTSADHSIASGNQGPVTAPVTAATVTAAVLDESPATNTDGNHKGGDKGSAAGPQIDAVTSADHSIASGNHVTAPVTMATVPATVLDDSTGIHEDGGKHKDGNHKGGNHKGGNQGSSAGPRIDAVTSGDHRIASGNKVTAPVTVAAFLTAVLGDSTAGNKDGGNNNGGDCKDGDKGSSAGPRINAVTSGDHRIASGNKVTAPVTVAAFSTAVLDDSTAINKDGTCKRGDKGSTAGPWIGAVTSGYHSIASGNQLIAPVTAPVTVGAVTAAVLDDSTAINKDGTCKDGTCKDGDEGSSAGPRIGAVTSDDHSVASGNPQWLLPAGVLLMLAGLLLMLVKRQEQ